MNLCILIGKIIGKIEFKFIINSEHKSIACFDLELSNKSIVKIKAYDEIADYCYKELSENDKILIYGKLNEKEEITIKELHKTLVKL